MTTNDVSLDYFLFSVYETERTIRAVPDSVKTDKRWPTGLKLDDQAPDADTSPDFGLLMDSMIAWYKETFPKLSDVHELDLTNLADVIQPFAMMLRDIRLAVLQKFSKDMPYLQDEDPDRVWDTIKNAFRKAFPDLSGWFQKYFEWSYNRPVVEEEDDDSRPPTGRFAPSMGRRGGPERPSRPSGDRRPSGGSERRDRPERGDDRKRGGQRKSGGQDEGRPPRGPRGEGRGGSDRAELEQQILQEVRSAAEDLRSNPDRSEIKLKPANSFFRHLQHSEIKEQGFFSKSAGEGNERSVVIMREPDGNR